MFSAQILYTMQLFFKRSLIRKRTSAGLFTLCIVMCSAVYLVYSNSACPRKLRGGETTELEDYFVVVTLTELQCFKDLILQVFTVKKSIYTYITYIRNV